MWGEKAWGKDVEDPGCENTSRAIIILVSDESKGWGWAKECMHAGAFFLT